VIRGAKREDVPAIRRLMEAEPGFWQPEWSDASEEAWSSADRPSSFGEDVAS